MNNDPDDSSSHQKKTADQNDDYGQPTDVHQLLRGRKELVLELDGQTYVLRITSNNKLILTK